MEVPDNPYFRIKAYLRKLGITERYGFSASEVDGSWVIDTWRFDIERPDISTIPMLTQEEYFQEQEDTGHYSNDIYIVGTDGVIRPDRRQFLSGLEDNKIVLEPGRYRLDSCHPLKFHVGDQEIEPIVKAIVPVRVSVETPSKETTVIIWKI